MPLGIYQGHYIAGNRYCKWNMGYWMPYAGNPGIRVCLCRRLLPIRRKIQFYPIRHGIQVGNPPIYPAKTMNAIVVAPATLEPESKNDVVAG